MARFFARFMEGFFVQSASYSFRREVGNVGRKGERRSSTADREAGDLFVSWFQKRSPDPSRRGGAFSAFPPFLGPRPDFSRATRRSSTRGGNGMRRKGAPSGPGIRLLAAEKRQKGSKHTREGRAGEGTAPVESALPPANFGRRRRSGKVVVTPGELLARCRSTKVTVFGPPRATRTLAPPPPTRCTQ